MTKIDPMTVATRFFNTPLLIEPRKATIIAQSLGPRFLGLESGQSVEVDGPADAFTADASGARQKPRAGSLIADGLYRSVKQYQGYSVVQGVAVISVVGSLVRRGSWVGQSSGVTSYEGLSAQVRAAVEDPEVKAIALEIDTFGGEAHGCFALAREIRAARAVKPVEAFLSEFALSAGYMIAAQADRITIPEFGDAGSIGVVMMHADFSGHLNQEGVRVTLIYSGAHKVEGNPYEPLPEGVRSEWQSEGDSMRLQFAEEVGAGRGNRLVANAAVATEAQTYRGLAAVQAGLADEVAEARDAFNAFVERMNPAPTRAVVPGANGRASSNGAPAHISSAHHLFFDALEAPDQALGRLEDQLTNGTVGVLVKARQLIERAASPKPEAAASSKGESDMSKTVEQPAASPRTDQDVKKQGENAEVTTAEAPKPETQTGVADASWVLERCDKAGISLTDARAMVDAKLSREQVLDKIIDAKAERAEDGGDIRPAGYTGVTGDARDRMREGMTKALLMKTGLDGGERNEFTSMSLKEMARKSLEGQGIVVQGGTMEFAGAVFAPVAASGGMHSTSDFPSILVNVANKAMLKGFSEAPETFEQFTSVGTMGDFKPTKRVGLDEFPQLLKVEDGAEFKYGSMGDHAETAVLATYGRLFAITRQTIINDDLDAFSRVPQKMGRAARRTVGDLAYGVLTLNPTMGDNVALFAAGHNNIAATAGVPSEATINAAITAMATQKDRSENATALNIAPAYLIAPPKYRSAVMQALNSEYAPDDTDKAGSSKMSRAYNTVKDAANPIFDARLTGDEWFMAADPSVHDVIEIGYLDGNPAPFLEQQMGWTVDGTEFKVRIDACATPMAFQTLFRNAGS